MSTQRAKRARYSADVDSQSCTQEREKRQRTSMQTQNTFKMCTRWLLSILQMEDQCAVNICQAFWICISSIYIRCPRKAEFRTKEEALHALCEAGKMICVIGPDLKDDSFANRVKLTREIRGLFKEFDLLQRFMLEITSSLEGAECYELMRRWTVLPRLLELNKLALDKGLFMDIDRVKITLDNAAEKHLKGVFEGSEYSEDSDNSESDMHISKGQPDSLMETRDRHSTGTGMSGVITKRPQSTVEGLEKENEELKRERTDLLEQIEELERINTVYKHTTRKVSKMDSKFQKGIFMSIEEWIDPDGTTEDEEFQNKLYKVIRENMDEHDTIAAKLSDMVGHV